MKKGYRHSKATREKMRIVALTRDNTNRLKAIPKGKDHWHYSENPTVSAIHRWLNNWHGRANKCEGGNHSNSKEVKKFDWALIHGKTYAKNSKNFIQLCRSCHVKYDFTDERRKKIGIAVSKRYV